ncbi:HEC/Ndc80p family-domain-containing protein [Coprinopsis sp. MPI-PUGE-AT-0042]|nr:HEC/Ndc80p family-domain-containing protein [Coprinopsis sp. MPI-PUGE-AT-0042]
MDSGRRSVLLESQNARSHLPVPSTIKKSSSSALASSSKSRMSLAGPALRPPQMPPPSTNPRQSMARQSIAPMGRSQNINPLLMSVGKQRAGQTPLHNARRGSTWAGAGLPPPTMSQAVKDPRPLRERAYQLRMKQDVLAFLQANAFDITMATLNNIAAKDFRTIFTFLVYALDPETQLEDIPNFQDIFVPHLKALRYPFAHLIDNKWLAAPASMHSWPSLLGVLHWLVEMCKLRDDYLSSGHPTLQDPGKVATEFEDPLDHAALAFDYFEETYTLWLDLVDDFVEPNQALEERYAQRNNGVQIELDEQTKLLEDAQKKLKALEASAPPIHKLTRDNGLLKGDSEKFQKILQQYESRKKKLTDSIAFEKAELQRELSHLDRLQADHDRLLDVVKTQNLSPEEVHKMNTDHETLTRTLQELKQKIADTQKIVHNLEVSVTNRGGAAEEAIDLYTNLLTSLELFPPLPEPWDSVDLTLELNLAVSNPQQLLVGADIRKAIKPTLSAIAESKRGERSSVENERIKVDNELDQLTLECENVEEDVGEVEKKVAVLNDQADDLRDAAQQEALVSNQEAARLERDIAHTRTAALANGMGVKSRLQGLQFDYREQMEKVSRLKEETIRAILKNSHEVAMFKEEVSRHLRELREFAEAD